MTFVPFLLDLCSWSIKTNNVEVGDKQVVSCDSYLGTFFIGPESDHWECLSVTD